MTQGAATYRLFAVYADADTGEWLGQPEEIGEVACAEHHAKTDTHDELYDIFDYDGQTCAVVVRWIEGAAP